MEELDSHSLFLSGPSTLGHVKDRVLEQTVYNISNDIVSLVDLQQLIPFLVQHNFLTKSEQDYLTDDKESPSVRIRRQLVPLLMKGGADALSTFYACIIAASDGHPGHVTLARKLRYEFCNELSQMEKTQIFHSSYVEQSPCNESYKPVRNLFDQSHQVILHFAKRLKKHIGEDLKYGNLQLLAIQLGMSFDIGLQIMDTYAPHEYYDKVFEYFLNGMCGGEATPARLILALVKQKGFGRFLCHICDMWGFAPSFYAESLAKCLSSEWPTLARHLGYTEKEIADIQDENGEDVHKQACALFQLWKIPDCGPHTWDVIYNAFYFAKVEHVIEYSLTEITTARSELNFTLAVAQNAVRLEKKPNKPQVRKLQLMTMPRKHLVPSLPLPKPKRLRKHTQSMISGEVPCDDVGIIDHSHKWFYTPCSPTDDHPKLPSPIISSDISVITEQTSSVESHYNSASVIEPGIISSEDPVPNQVLLAETSSRTTSDDNMSTRDSPSNVVQSLQMPIKHVGTTADVVCINKDKSVKKSCAYQDSVSSHYHPDQIQNFPTESLSNEHFPVPPDTMHTPEMTQGSQAIADLPFDNLKVLTAPSEEHIDVEVSENAMEDSLAKEEVNLPANEGFSERIRLLSPVNTIPQICNNSHPIAEMTTKVANKTTFTAKEELTPTDPKGSVIDAWERMHEHKKKMPIKSTPTHVDDDEIDSEPQATNEELSPQFTFQRPVRQQSYSQQEMDDAFQYALNHLTSSCILRDDLHIPVFVDDKEHFLVFATSPTTMPTLSSTSELLRALSNPVGVDTDLVMTLLDSGADLTIRDEYGAQPLHHAANRGLYDIVKAMICRDVDLNSNCTNDVYGWTPLGAACFHDQFEVVDLLLEHGANPNKLDHLGRNCLLLGSVLKNERILTKFLDCGADVNVKAHRYNTTPLALACLLGEVPACKLLLERGADPRGYSLSEVGMSPLLASVYAQNLELIELLVNCGACIDTMTPNLFTPLHVACLLRNLEIVEILVNHGANVNSRAEDNESPLMTAVTSGAVDIVKFLLSNGANPFVDRCMNKKSLRILISTLGEAALAGHVDVFEVLMQYDADVNYTDKGVVSVLTLACVGGSEDIVDYLMKTNEIDVSCEPSLELSVVLAAKRQHRKCLDIIVDKVGLDTLMSHALERPHSLMMDALKPYQCGSLQVSSETAATINTEDSVARVQNNNSYHSTNLSNDLSSSHDPLEASGTSSTTVNYATNDVSEQTRMDQLSGRVNDQQRILSSLQQSLNRFLTTEGSSSLQTHLSSGQQRTILERFLPNADRISIQSHEERKRLVSLLRFLIIAAGDINDLVTDAMDNNVEPAVSFLTGYSEGKYDDDDQLIQYVERTGPSAETLDFIVRKAFSITRLIELARGLDHHLAHEHFKRLQQHMEQERRDGLTLMEILGLSGANKLVDIVLPTSSIPGRCEPTPTSESVQNDLSSVDNTPIVPKVHEAAEIGTSNSFDCEELNIVEKENVFPVVRYIENSFVDTQRRFDSSAAVNILSPPTAADHNTLPCKSTGCPVVQVVEVQNNLQEKLGNESTLENKAALKTKSTLGTKSTLTSPGQNYLCQPTSRGDDSTSQYVSTTSKSQQPSLWEAAQRSPPTKPKDLHAKEVHSQDEEDEDDTTESTDKNESTDLLSPTENGNAALKTVSSIRGVDQDDNPMSSIAQNHLDTLNDSLHSSSDEDSGSDQHGSPSLRPCDKDVVCSDHDNVSGPNSTELLQHKLEEVGSKQDTSEDVGSQHQMFEDVSLIQQPSEDLGQESPHHISEEVELPQQTSGHPALISKTSDIEQTLQDVPEVVQQASVEGKIPQNTSKNAHLSQHSPEDEGLPQQLHGSKGQFGPSCQISLNLCSNCRVMAVYKCINTQDIVHKEILLKVSRKVGSVWSILARRLGVADGPMEDVKRDYITAAERCNKILIGWIDREWDFRPWYSADQNSKVLWLDLQEALCRTQQCALVEYIHYTFEGGQMPHEMSLLQQNPYPLQPLDPKLVHFCSQMNSHWRKLSDYMGFSILEESFPDDDLAFEVIHRWIDAKGTAATKENLCKCLAECNLGFLCKELHA